MKLLARISHGITWIHMESHGLQSQTGLGWEGSLPVQPGLENCWKINLGDELLPIKKIMRALSHILVGSSGSSNQYWTFSSAFPTSTSPRGRLCPSQGFIQALVGFSSWELSLSLSPPHPHIHLRVTTPTFFPIPRSPHVSP